MAKRCKPTPYSKELALKIAAKIGKGMTDRQACAACKASPRTVEEWRRKRPEFVEILEYADACRVEIRIDVVEAHEEGWQSAAWLLERTKASQFARPDIQQQINIVQASQIVPGLNMSQADWQAYREQLNRLQAVDGKPGELNPFLSLVDSEQPSRNS